MNVINTSDKNIQVHHQVYGLFTSIFPPEQRYSTDKIARTDELTEDGLVILANIQNIECTQDVPQF